MFLRSPQQIEQEAAQKGALTAGRLAARRVWPTVNDVVETRDERVRTTCLYRYPSPVGRCSQFLARPPVFFSDASAIFAYKQQLAQNPANKPIQLPNSDFRPIVAVNKAVEHKGDLACICGTGFWELRAVRCSQPAAETSANKRSWARGPARPRPLCWTGAHQLALSSVLRPTSPIANNTRRAAVKRAAPASVPDMNRKPVAARQGRSGFFVAIAPWKQMGPRPEGTLNVQ